MAGAILCRYESRCGTRRRRPVDVHDVVRRRLSATGRVVGRHVDDVILRRSGDDVRAGDGRGRLELAGRSARCAGRCRDCREHAGLCLGHRRAPSSQRH